MTTAQYQMAEHTRLSFLSDLYECFNPNDIPKPSRTPGPVWEQQALGQLTQETWDTPDNV